MSDLVKRLRGLCKTYIPTCCEAADRIVALEDERDALRKAHQQLLGIINDKHEVGPEHDSEPPIFHKGWELCARAIMKLYKESL